MISVWVAGALAASLAHAPLLSTADQRPGPVVAQSPAPVAPAPATTAEPNPFRNLLTNLGTDAKALATSTDSAWILGLGGAGALIMHQRDDDLHSWVLKQPVDSSVASFGSVLGDGFTQGGLAVAVWGIGRASSHRRVEHTGSDLIRAQVLNGVITQAIKFGAGRERPSGGSHSFPSGHTSATFATAAVIHANYGIAAGLPAYAVGTFVGWSRIRGNHHWLSDAIFGAAVGLASGRAASHKHNTPWSIVPVKTSGGAALYLIRR